MSARLRSVRPPFHRALLASGALHFAVAGVVLLWARSRPASTCGPPLGDTGDVVVRMFDVGPSVEAYAPDISSAELPVPSAPPPTERTPPAPGTARPPHAREIPRTLSAETLSAIGRAVTARHVVGASPSAPALHGAMRPGQRIVYLLDCSGSMGEHGKLELARSALLATLSAQPEGVRFQVIVYDGSARALFPGTACVPASRPNLEAASAKLLGREAAGRSNHIEAIRLAARYRPDVILLLTDTASIGRDQIRAGFAQLDRPVSVSLARVTASRIEPPIELHR